MPMRSEKQRRAMHAAAEGRSTLGIPRDVGREFVREGMARKRNPKRRNPGASSLSRTVRY